MSESLRRLEDIIAQLRSPAGCPWDREQTHESLRMALLEECYEVVEAINRADDANLCEELGDLLLLVMMHAQIGSERGAFQFEEVARGICEKLIRRHPHVFGDAKGGDTTAAVLRQWEQIKRVEKGGASSVLTSISSALPALMRAQLVQKKVSRVGFDWQKTEDVFNKIEEEIREFQDALISKDRTEIEQEAGDVLFSLVNLLRKLQIDSETALNRSTMKFAARFQALETHLEKLGRRVEDCSECELNEIWNSLKLGEV
ncbi:MAG: nucleoside triphosphate pyrophosphohydrolase [Verrucomicrobia bacterium]|nr:MAG: nucleoside triphosphate pyrophosphohydrolase [Verrucomicrobiota bacterium]